MKKYAPLLMMLSLVVASIACGVAGRDGDLGNIDEQLQIGMTVEGRVWDDINANGIQDAGERGLPDVPVFLWDAGQNAVIESTRTNAQGEYVFTNVRANSGGYFIEFELLPGYLFTEQHAGSDLRLDSDVDEETGRTRTFETDLGFVYLDAGMIQGFLPPSTPTPEEPPPAATATEPVSSAGDEPTAVITTNSGCEVAYYGPTEVVHGEVLEVTFGVMCNGIPGTGTLASTFGDPPTSPDATHANGELDANGMVTLMLDVNWPVGMTLLYFAYERTVYEAAMMTIK